MTRVAGARATMLAKRAAIAVTDRPEPGVFEGIFKALDASSDPVVGPIQARLLVIPIHDDGGAVAGGFWGTSLFEWLQVMMLVVPPALRRHGLGTLLMQLAEAEARNRDCRGILVDTFSSQAVAFYERLGFSTFGELPDFPPGRRRVYLAKRLSNPAVGLAPANTSSDPASPAPALPCGSVAWAERAALASPIDRGRALSTRPDPA